MSEWSQKESTGAGETIISETPPASPSKGTKWIDESYRSPALKYYDGSGFVTLSPGSNVPSETSYTSSGSVSVSDINESVRIRLVAETGEGNGQGPGGAGGVGIVEVDLTPYDEIKIRPGSLDGSNPCGDNGCLNTYTFASGRYYPGEGGAGTAILDGNGNRIAIAGGGGGEGDYDTGRDDGYTWYQGSSGGDGGPTGDPVSGQGGYWDTLSGTTKRGYNKAAAGGIAAKQDSATVVSSNTVRDETPKVDMFI